jgi:hypothetical protein
MEAIAQLVVELVDLSVNAGFQSYGKNRLNDKSWPKSENDIAASCSSEARNLIGLLISAHDKDVSLYNNLLRLSSRAATGSIEDLSDEEMEIREKYSALRERIKSDHWKEKIEALRLRLDQFIFNKRMRSDPSSEISSTKSGPSRMDRLHNRTDSLRDRFTEVGAPQSQWQKRERDGIWTEFQKLLNQRRSFQRDVKMIEEWERNLEWNALGDAQEEAYDHRQSL